MIQKPKKISEMTWLQLAIVCLKLIIYIDSADIEELNQIGGAASEDNPQTESSISETDQKSRNEFKNDLADDIDVQNVNPGGAKNNILVFIITQLLSISKRVGKSVGVFMSTLFAKFIFAATLPALPFFLTMGASYSFIKYGAFKIREI